jgi:hypothetical protein
LLLKGFLFVMAIVAVFHRINIRNQQSKHGTGEQNERCKERVDKRNIKWIT